MSVEIPEEKPHAPEPDMSDINVRFQMALHIVDCWREVDLFKDIEYRVLDAGSDFELIRSFTPFRIGIPKDATVTQIENALHELITVVNITCSDKEGAVESSIAMERARVEEYSKKMGEASRADRDRILKIIAEASGQFLLEEARVN